MLRACLLWRCPPPHTPDAACQARGLSSHAAAAPPRAQVSPGAAANAEVLGVDADRYVEIVSQYPAIANMSKAELEEKLRKLAGAFGAKMEAARAAVAMKPGCAPPRGGRMGGASPSLPANARPPGSARKPINTTAARATPAHHCAC